MKYLSQDPEEKENTKEEGSAQDQPLWISDTDYWENGLTDKQRDGYLRNLIEKIQQENNKKEDEKNNEDDN